MDEKTLEIVDKAIEAHENELREGYNHLVGNSKIEAASLLANAVVAVSKVRSIIRKLPAKHKAEVVASIEQAEAIQQAVVKQVSELTPTDKDVILIQLLFQQKINA
jgi:hypothetical protein